MNGLDFSETAGFDANLEVFIQRMEAEDAEFGVILRESISELRGATDDSSRRSVRAKFNAKVHIRLDKLGAAMPGGETFE